MKSLQECKCCGEQRRVRHRDFSLKAWASLVHWEEVDSEAVGQPICSSCYEDLRELLIERASEVSQDDAVTAIQDSPAIEAGPDKTVGQSSLAS